METQRLEIVENGVKIRGVRGDVFKSSIISTCCWQKFAMINIQKCCKSTLSALRRYSNNVDTNNSIKYNWEERKEFEKFSPRKAKLFNFFTLTFGEL